MPPERDAGEGLRETSDNGDTLTVNSTNDPDVPDGYYVSQTVDGEKTTNVYDSDDNFVKSSPESDDE